MMKNIWRKLKIESTPGSLVDGGYSKYFKNGKLAINVMVSDEWLEKQKQLDEKYEKILAAIVEKG